MEEGPERCGGLFVLPSNDSLAVEGPGRGISVLPTDGSSPEEGPEQGVPVLAGDAVAELLATQQAQLGLRGDPEEQVKPTQRVGQQRRISVPARHHDVVLGWSQAGRELRPLVSKCGVCERRR